MKTQALTRLIATDRRTAARRIFLELHKFFPQRMQLSNLDSTIKFECELQPVVTTLRRLGFDQHSDSVFHRDGLEVVVKVPRTGWNPILSIH
jgi:hypothetical protein